ncbi:hypothetical protein NEF87_002772 [Candidatus Lokiarchaeum ossiferum]|uniref:Uncharacterized protein n=1 Tax=Candidatus Lokiarchaeum ossiferum TaxID=2951803 RepID=A0ABY6HSI9_9ARCH|nr:hypothetical protein NEF87_002772 [Candidatus Lokiarchaeum sp. B-35]
MDPFITVNEQTSENTPYFSLPIYFCNSCIAKRTVKELKILKSWDHLLGGKKLLDTWYHGSRFTGSLRWYDNKRKETSFGELKNAIKKKK